MTNHQSVRRPADPLEALIRQAFADRVKQIAELEIAEAQRRIETAIRKMVGQIAIEVGQHYTVQFSGREIVIRVQTDGLQESNAPQGVHGKNPPYR